MLAELRAALAALAAELGRRGGRARGARRRHHEPQRPRPAGGRDVVVRLPGKDTALLGIDRDAERAATEAAAARCASGPTSSPTARRPPCLVTRFIAGRALSAEELRDAGACSTRWPARCARSTAGRGCPSRFDAFAIVSATTRRRSPAGRRSRRRLRRARGRRARHPAALGGAGEHAPVPCHNDLLTANFIHDGVRLRILDWEYAGMGDRYFDLGNLSVNNGFAEADDERLLAVYWGEP